MARLMKKAIFLVLCLISCASLANAFTLSRHVKLPSGTMTMVSKLSMSASVFEKGDKGKILVLGGSGKLYVLQ